MPDTLRLNPETESHLDLAAAILRAGGTVAFPTETVYGLGANALSASAVARIFAAKQRPSWDPVIVHLASSEQLAPLVHLDAALVERVQTLASAFWPGPLTLLLPRSAAIPDAVTAGRPLVGVRIPAHPVALALLRAAQLPIAAPSANTFSHTSPTTAAHVLADLDGRIDAVLDGGPTSVGVESTVLDPHRMIVYRPGAVTLDQIAAATRIQPTLYVPPSEPAPQASLPAPGVGLRHYAPRATLTLVPGTPGALQQAIHERQGHSTTGVLLPTDWPLATGETKVFRWGSWSHPEELATRLFAGLRLLDDQGVTEILCPTPPAIGLGQAILDRLEKASRRA